MPDRTTTRIALYSDHPILARGLALVITAAEGFELVSCCDAMPQLLDCVSRARPDIALLDFPAEIPLDALVELNRLPSPCRTVLWVPAMPTDIASQLLTLGIWGILRNTLQPEALIDCLRKIRHGEYCFERALVATFLTGTRVRITTREWHLITAVSHGLKNKEIATALQISEGTVKVYLSRLYEKLGMEDRFELALFGLKHLASGQSSDIQRTHQFVHIPPGTAAVDRLPAAGPGSALRSIPMVRSGHDLVYAAGSSSRRAEAWRGLAAMTVLPAGRSWMAA